MSPSSAAPVKNEISEVLEAITMMGKNLQRVLMAPQMAPHLRTQDFPYQSANQASFTANLLEIQSQEQIWDRRASVTSPTPPEVIIKKKQELGSLGRKKNSDQFHLKEYSKVLQARSKEMSSGKEQKDLLGPFASKTDQPTTPFSAERHVGHPRSKPLPPTLSHPLSCHLTLLLFHTPQMGQSSSHKYMHQTSLAGSCLHKFSSQLKSCYL